MIDIREYERCYLGALLISAEKGSMAETCLKPEDFEDNNHGRIFQAMLELWRDGTTPDTITLFRELKDINRNVIVGIATTMPSDANIGYYENLIYEASRKRFLRRALQTAVEYVDKGKQTNDIVLDLMPALSEALKSQTDSGRSRFFTWESFITKCRGYDPDKDFKPSMLAGLRFPNGTISYIGARPGGGKTTILINIAREALDAGRNVFFVNLEMLNASITANFILSTMYAEADEDRRYDLDDIDAPMSRFYSLFKNEYDDRETFDHLRKKAMEKTASLLNSRFFIYDGSGASLETVIADIESRVKSGDLVLIDYIQRMKPPRGNNDQRYIQVKLSSNALLSLALKKEAVIISGAQFGRSKGEAEADMSAFRESGDIEQDAHNALAVESIDMESRYIHVLKAREGGADFERQELECRFEYLYIAGTEKEYVLPAEKKSKKRMSKKERLIAELGYDPDDPNMGYDL